MANIIWKIHSKSSLQQTMYVLFKPVIKCSNEQTDIQTCLMLSEYCHCEREVCCHRR